jgi:hypothetical protein
VSVASFFERVSRDEIGDEAERGREGRIPGGEEEGVMEGRSEGRGLPEGLRPVEVSEGRIEGAEPGIPRENEEREEGEAGIGRAKSARTARTVAEAANASASHEG